jgi:hypothetical protein
MRNLAAVARGDGLRHGLEVGLERALRLIRRQVFRLRATHGTGAEGRRAPDFKARNLALTAAHPARPYPGRLTVVVGQESRPPFLHDAAADLAGLATDGVEVVVLPGDDHDHLRTPLAERLARVLAARMDVRASGSGAVGDG